MAILTIFRWLLQGFHFNRRRSLYETGKGAVASPTASPLLPFNWTQVIKVNPGEQLSAVSNDAVAGTLVVVELS